MNKKLGQRLIEISKALKPQKSSGSKFHTSFALKQNKIICIGWNDYNKLHCEHRFGKYHNHKGFETEYRPSRHSESHLLVKLGELDLSSYEIVNVRISNNGNAIMSRPCANCETLLSQFSPKRIFYTNDDGEFEQI